MHVQIINFRLIGITEQEYSSLCDQLAPAFAALPGLLEKVWLADTSQGVYGGVYFWETLSAMKSFAASDLFATVAGHPNLTDITSRDFATLSGPTDATSRIRHAAA